MARWLKNYVDVFLRGDPVNRNEILGVLEEHATGFEFPVLDNVNFHFLAGRLRGFEGHGQWALVFEFFGFSPQEPAFPIDVYAYGPLANAGGAWQVRQLDGIVQVPDFPLWDSAGQWIRGVDSRWAAVRGRRIEFVSSPGPRGSILLSHGDTVDEDRFGAAVARELGLGHLLEREAVGRVIPDLGRASQLFELSGWDHPDIAAGQGPRDSSALVACAAVLSGEAATLVYDHNRDNLDFTSWRRVTGKSRMTS